MDRQQKNSTVSPKSYTIVYGWMITELGLKGNELLVYAVIYGFTRNSERAFDGSLQYLADWTNSTIRGVIKSLKSLVEKNLIHKQEIYANGVKYCRYCAAKFTDEQSSLGMNKVQGGGEQSSWGVVNKVQGGGEQSSHNSIDNNKDNNKEETLSQNTLRESLLAVSKEIISFLNEQAGTSYKPGSERFTALIGARLNEGFTPGDFKTVIGKKCREWRGTKWEKYLRPETLFGEKFETYLNERFCPDAPQGSPNSAPDDPDPYSMDLLHRLIEEA